MASFTDDSRILGSFNPYVQQVPVDAYVSVGLQKQQQYNQGVQQTQAAIDSVTNLPVVKDVQKQYLNERIGQLQSSISKVVGQDFSNPQLVNQIQGLTGQIAKDPIIQSAVQSSAAISANDGKMAQAIKEGKSGAENEWAYNDAKSRWLNDGDAKSAFTGSYKQFTDVDGLLLKKINEGLKPDEQIQELPFKMENGQKVLDASGAPIPDVAMIKKVSKTLTAEKVQAAINAAMTGDIQEQLAINGRYQYRGVDKAGMKKVTDDSYNYRVNQSNDILKGLAVKKLSNVNDRAYQEDLDNQIQNQTIYRDNLVKQYPQDIKFLDQNPEAYKGSLYTQSFTDNLTHSLKHADVALTYEKNPYWDGMMDARKDAREAAKFNFEVQKFGIENQREWYKAETERAKLEKELGKTKDRNGNTVNSLGELGAGVAQPIDVNTAPKATIADFNKTTDDQNAALEGATRQLLLNTPELSKFVNLLPPRDNETSPRIEYSSPTAEAEAKSAIAQLLDDDAKLKTMSPAIQEYANKFRDIKSSVENRNFVAAKINQQADQIINPDQAFKNIGGLRLRVPNGKEFADLHVSGGDFGRFAQQLNAVTSYEDSGIPNSFGTENSKIPVYDEQKGIKQFTDPKDRLMFQVLLDEQKGVTPNASQKAILDRIHQAQNSIPQHLDNLNKRDAFMNRQANLVAESDVPTEFPVQLGKGDKVMDLRGVGNALLNKYNNQDKLDANTDISDVRKALSNEKSTYSIMALGNGQYAYRVNGDKGSFNIPMKQEDVEANFPGSTVQQFAKIKQDLALSKNIGPATTDFRGKGELTANVLKNSNLNNYAVRFHVEQPSTNGGYQVRLYIRDKGKDGDPAGGKSGIVYPLPSLFGDNGLAYIMQNFGDEDVQKLLSATTPKK